MDIADISLFVEAARKGNFAAVARDRNVDPSSISRVVARLERELGVRLFQRTTRKLGLTEAGSNYLARVESLIEELEHAGSEAASLTTAPSGTLRLTASVTFGQLRIVPLLSQFRANYPELKLECIFSDRNLDLVEERIDLAIRLAPAIGGDVVTSKLMDTHYRVVASPDYLAFGPALSRPDDLSRHRCLLFDLREYRSRWLFRDGSGVVSDIPIDGDVTLSPAGSLRDAALMGLGPALLPDWLVGDDIRAGRLVDVFPHHAVTATTFETAAWIVYPSRLFLPNKVRVMIDFLREKLAGGAAGPAHTAIQSAV